MAIMINCGRDWTFDMFMEDAKLYKATPCKGVHCPKDADYRQYFMTTLKNYARDFKEEWFKTHEHLYDSYDGYIGDAFARSLYRFGFSDFYKEAYYQRPHLDTWYYVHAVGFPQSEDTARMFCASPVEYAINNAKRTREWFENEDEKGFEMNAYTSVVRD